MKKNTLLEVLIGKNTVNLPLLRPNFIRGETSPAYLHGNMLEMSLSLQSNDSDLRKTKPLTVKTCFVEAFFSPIKTPAMKQDG